MKKFNYEVLVKNLPDSFDKKHPIKDNKYENSNNNKILSIDSEINAAFFNAISEIETNLDIDIASLNVLDMFGERLKLERGSMSDEQYRIMLKAKIASNSCDGTRESIANVLSFILNCPSSDIKIKSGNSTGEVILENIPLELLINAEFTISEIIDIINNLLAEGVKIYSYGFTGTFEFGEQENDYEENKGFSDGKTIGGYLGVNNTLVD